MLFIFQLPDGSCVSIPARSLAGARTIANAYYGDDYTLLTMCSTAKPNPVDWINYPTLPTSQEKSPVRTHEAKV